MSLLFNLAAGVVDVHLLMALAAFGTLPLGCPGEGALLLALFASAHLVEDRLMTVEEGDLSQLLDATPATAMRVAIRPFDMGPDLQSLTEVREGGGGGYDWWWCVCRTGTRIGAGAMDTGASASSSSASSSAASSSSASASASAAAPSSSSPSSSSFSYPHLV